MKRFQSIIHQHVQMCDTVPAIETTLKMMPFFQITKMLAIVYVIPLGLFDGSRSSLDHFIVIAPFQIQYRHLDRISLLIYFLRFYAKFKIRAKRRFLNTISRFRC